MVQNGLVKAGDDEELLEPDLDPLVDEDFVVILKRLTDKLSTVTERQDAQALRNALDLLDITWVGLSAAAVTRLVAAVRAVLAGSVEKVIPRTSPIFTAAARAVIPATRINLISRDKLALDPQLTEADRRTGQSLLSQQGHFIRDEYGRRADVAIERVKAIVSAGLRDGFSQADITAALANDLTLAQLGRARTYWEVIGTSFANRARTTTQLSAYAEAKVQTYRFVAVIDDRTSQICRYLNNRIFRVKPALARLRKAEELTDPQAIRNALPWVNLKTDSHGRLGLFFDRAGRSNRVAWVDRDTGEFTEGLSDDELEAAGVAVPPLHARCRSTIVREN
jgi:SPP1 gp7 family putative phage head morphogenesis protein